MSSYATMVTQYATLHLLPDWARLIDDLEYENFHIPELMHQSRRLKHVDGNFVTEPNHQYVEADYADAKPSYEYEVPALKLQDSVSWDDEERLKCINAAVRASLIGHSLPRQLLRKCLTAEQLLDLDQQVETASHPSEVTYGGGVPQYLRSYIEKLQRADFVWYQLEQASSRESKTNRRRSNAHLEDKAESLYEDAFERLIEVYSDAKVGNLGKEAMFQLHAWFDRRIELDLDDLSQTNIALGPHTMPRVRGTKSQYAEDSGLPKLSKKAKKKYLALRVLLEAAVEIAFDIPNKTLGVTQEDSDRLRSMLTALGKSDRV